MCLYSSCRRLLPVHTSLKQSGRKQKVPVLLVWSMEFEERVNEFNNGSIEIIQHKNRKKKIKRRWTKHQEPRKTMPAQLIHLLLEPSEENKRKIKKKKTIWRNNSLRFPKFLWKTAYRSKKISNPPRINTYTFKRILVEQLKTKDKKEILKALREKRHITKGRTMIWIMVDYSSETTEEIISILYKFDKKLCDHLATAIQPVKGGKGQKDSKRRNKTIPNHRHHKC